MFDIIILICYPCLLYTLCLCCLYLSVSLSGQYFTVEKWVSQPHIKDTSAGNSLQTTAVLFSGATPAKICEC